MTRMLERALHLRPGDLGRGALLFSYLFLIITSYVMGKVARDALFLDRFQAVQLPYADIAIAVLVGFVVAGYLSVGRRLSVAHLLAGSNLFFAANCVLFWWLAHFYHQAWLYPVFYVWVGIFGVLAPMQVWTLANYVLTTREAKRVFGLVGSGAISGWIAGGFLSKQGATRFGTESLLLGLAVFLGICSVLVVLIWRQKEAGQLDSPPAAKDENHPQSVVESLRQVWSARYLRAIAAVICISSFVTTIAGWQFKAISKQFLVEKDILAAFFGDFNFYAGLICLVTQLLLTSRLLRRFGIGVALFVVPVALLFGTVGVAVWGTLAAAIWLKGSDQVLRYSIDKSSVELLYLPLPVTVKMQVKSFIDTVIWRLGDGLAGLTVLLFATYLGLTASQISWVNLVLIAGWLAAALVARREYVATLRESIHQHRLDTERAIAPVLDRSTVEIMARNLTAADPAEVLYALKLFGVSRQRTSHPAVRGLLYHPAAEVRAKAITLLSESGDKLVVSEMEKLLKDPDLEVRTEALLYLTHHARIDPLDRIQELGDFPDFSIRSGMVAFLAQPGETQNLVAARHILGGMVAEEGSAGRRSRLEAARLIASLPDHFEEELRPLVSDADAEVAGQAVVAVGRLRKRRLLPPVLERLHVPQTRQQAADALVEFGDAVVGTLHDHLNDPAIPLDVRGEVSHVLARIGTQAAERVLVENLLQADTGLRFRILSALNKLHPAHPELEMDVQMVESVLAAEIMGHYRSYQILGTLGGDLSGDESMARALRESMEQEVERIFRLLALLHPHYDLHSAYVGLQSRNPVVHDNALEFLDNVLKPPLRSALVPLLDGEVSVAERARLGARLVHTQMQSREEAVAALLESEDPWLKSCGAYAIGCLGLFSMAIALESCLEHPDPLLRETARQARIRLVALSNSKA